MGDGGAAVLVVPAYNPAVGLPDLIRRILAASPTPFAGAVIVDDGSVVTAQPVFAAVEAIPSVVVLRRPANGGKGAALKDGYRARVRALAGRDRRRHCRRGWPARSRRRDAGGAYAGRAPGLPGAGRARLDGRVPLRSRVGNQTARALVGWVAGERFADTQTGLRGWPRSMAQRSRQLASSGYDFELDALLEFRAVPRIEVPIATIYLDENCRSHFRPIRDSIRIGRVLWRHFRR